MRRISLRCRRSSTWVVLGSSVSMWVLRELVKGLFASASLVEKSSLFGLRRQWTSFSSRHYRVSLISRMNELASWGGAFHGGIPL